MEQINGIPGDLSRRGFLRGGLGLAGATALGLLGCRNGETASIIDETPTPDIGDTTVASASNTSTQSADPQSERTLYWLTDGFDEAADRIAGYDLASRNAITDVHLSFVGVTSDGLPTLEGSGITKESAARAQQIFPNARIGLAIGGANGSTKESWGAVLAQPERFNAKLVEICNKLGCLALSLDYEAPSAEQRKDFTKFVTVSANALGSAGIHKLAVAIPPTPYTREGLDLARIITIPSVVLHDMTYDFHGNWDATIQHDSPEGEVEKSINDLLQFVPPNQLAAGINFYGRRYSGVSNPGDKINVNDKKIDNTIGNLDIRALTSQPGWHVVQTPEGAYVVRAANQEVISILPPPAIGSRVQRWKARGIGAFAWDAHNMTNDDLMAFAA